MAHVEGQAQAGQKGCSQFWIWSSMMILFKEIKDQPLR
jgi:hypothetical protein